VVPPVLTNASAAWAPSRSSLTISPAAVRSGRGGSMCAPAGSLSDPCVLWIFFPSLLLFFLL
jgi:hypothetical protein